MVGFVTEIKSTDFSHETFRAEARGDLLTLYPQPEGWGYFLMSHPPLPLGEEGLGGEGGGGQSTNHTFPFPPYLTKVIFLVAVKFLAGSERLTASIL